MLATCVLFGLATITQAELEGFIVGGEFTQIRKFPHSVFLYLKCAYDDSVKPNYIFLCGGSIINQKIVLTAAHCFYPCNANSIVTINMGDENRFMGVSRAGSSFIYHEKYYPNLSLADIALAKMSRPVTFNSHISRVAIMKRPPYGEAAYLAGWGLMDERLNDTYSTWIKSLDQKVWIYETCKKMIGWIPRGTICASSNTPDHFAAHGDSGGALIVRGYIQIGVVSHKVPWAANNVIIYSDVGYYYDWITHNAHRLYCEDS